MHPTTLRFLSVTIFGLGACGPALRATADVSFQGLGFFPGQGLHSHSYGVSGDGSTVVGWADFGPEQQAYRWTSADGMVGLGFLPNGSKLASGAVCASFDGSVIGGGGLNGQNYEAFRWSADTGMVGLGGLHPDRSSSVAAVSADGTIFVGASGTHNGSTAARWVTGKGWTGLGNLGLAEDGGASGISEDGSVAVGFSDNAEGNEEAFRWTKKDGMTGLGYFPNEPTWDSQATATSSDGSVVVGSAAFDDDNGNGAFEAFRWTDAGGMAPLGFLVENTWSAATCTSGDGSIIAGYAYTTDDPGGDQAFFWTAEKGMVNLRELLLARGANVSGWVLKSATGISKDGRTIVGNGTDPNGHTEGWVATIPVPATVALAPALLIGTRRRR